MLCGTTTTSKSKALQARALSFSSNGQRRRFEAPHQVTELPLGKIRTSGNDPAHNDPELKILRRNTHSQSSNAEKSRVGAIANNGEVEPQLALARSGPLLFSMKEMVELHDRVATKRIGLEIQQNNYNAQWKHTSDHLDKFLDAASSFMLAARAEGTVKDIKLLAATYERLQQSASHLQRWQKEGRHAQQDLTKLEGLLSEKEDEVYHQLRHITEGPSATNPFEGENRRSMDYASMSESDLSARSNPIEHDYYDKVGDLHLIQEAIHNLTAEQQRLKIERNLAIDTGAYVPSESERRTYERYIEDHRRLVKEYFDTKQNMERLQKLCEQQGLDVAPPNLSPVFDLSRIAEEDSANVHSDAPKLAGIWSPDEWLMFGGVDKRNHVLRWLEVVPDGPGSPASLELGDAATINSHCSSDAIIHNDETGPPAQAVGRDTHKPDVAVVSLKNMSPVISTAQLAPDANLRLVSHGIGGAKVKQKTCIGRPTMETSNVLRDTWLVVGSSAGRISTQRQALGNIFQCSSEKRHSNRKLITTFRIWLPVFHRLWSSITLLHSPFSSGSLIWTYSRVVPQDDNFLQACLVGDVYQARMCCIDHRIPKIVSQSNMTPLLYAVQSGKSEVVELLLHCGADVNQSGGRRETSPLQWAIRHNQMDIVRILLRNGADIDHVSLLGWTPIFYCWPDLKASWEDRTEMIKLLHDRSVLSPNHADTIAWTALQRAAAFGTKNDMELMLRLWAQLHSDYRWKSGGTGWEVIHFAVQAGNLPTFQVLMDLYEPIVAEVFDARGWSLLHIAATRPAETSQDPMGILRRLLAAGCDPERKTFPSRFEDIDGGAYTAEDIAMRTGASFHASYVDILKDLGLGHDRVDEESFELV